MIHVDRSRVRAPAVLVEGEGVGFQRAATSFFRAKEKSRRQRRFEFPPFSDSGFAEVTARLDDLFYRKCAYCERPLVRQGLDRFRPKQNARGLKEDFAPDHYWWLAYGWENIYACCDDCNKIKGPWFPVDGRRAPRNTPWADLAKEKRLLLDPCADEPAEDLTFQPDGQVIPKTRRGEMTIQVLELNRPDLVSGRRAAAQETHPDLIAVAAARRRGDWLRVSEGVYPADFSILLLRIRKIFGAKTYRLIEESTAANRPFAAARRGVVRDLLDRSLRMPGPKAKRPADSARALRPSVRQRDVKEARQLATRYVTRVAIKNFKAIRDLELEIPPEASKKASWLTLLGENGTGKSSILQAIALTLIEDRQHSELRVRPIDVLRQGAAAGWVRVTLSGSPKPIELRFGKGQWRFQRAGEIPDLLLLGYGATRLLPRGAGRARRAAIRVTNLFDPFVPLLNADRWLGKLDRGVFDYVARGLKDVLSLPATSRLVRIRRAGTKGVTLQMFGAKLGLDQLSDGYQSVLGLVCDVISGLQVKHAGGLEVAEGLVLIDELGAHLHPRWRMRIVGSLRRAFPRVQFLTSTHDPLCLRGLNNKEVAVLRRTPRGRIFTVPDLPPIEGLRSEQLLTSEYFGLNSTLDPEIEQKFNELYRLLALRSKNDAQREQIEVLRRELRPFDLPGANQRERELLQGIDERLAQKRFITDPEALSAFETASRARVADDLNRLFA